MPRTVFEAFTNLHNRQALTPTQATTAANRERTIREYFNANHDMFYPVFSIGSYNRGTICGGERDIDLMACFKGYGPDVLRPRFEGDSSQFLYWVRNDLNDHYYRTDVSSKRVAVTLDFTDIVTEVTPCFLNTDDRGGFLMPDGHGGWQLTNPPFHASRVEEADQVKEYRLKPIIRLMKA